MKRRLLAILLVVAMCLSLFPVTAMADEHPDPSAKCGDNLTWSLDDAGTLTISGTGDMYNYDPVYYLGSGYENAPPWYGFRDSIKKVIIGDGVTSVGSYAFASCYNLTSATIGNSVTSIGHSAFSWCGNLKQINFKGSLPEIDSGCFYSVSAIAEYPAGDTTYENAGTYGAENLIWVPDDASDDFIIASGDCGESITWKLALNGKLTITGTGAMTDYNYGISGPWYGKRYFIESVEISEGITSICSYAFSGCSELENINVSPENAAYTSIEGIVFSKDKKSLVVYPAGKSGAYTVPDGVTSIVGSAFCSCSGLTSVDIPDGVTSIGENAFNSCSGLTSVDIPDGVTSIGYRAFGGCYNLNTICFNGNKPNIENNAFEYDNLIAVYPAGNETYSGAGKYGASTLFWVPDNQNYIASGVWGESITWQLLTDGTLYLSGTGPMPDFHSGDSSEIPWNEYKSNILSVEIGDGITAIGDHVFANYSKIKSVKISSSVQTIGDTAFQYCSKLESITIGNGVQSIGSSAFKYTAYYNDNSNWEDGVLYIGDCLIEANESKSKSGTFDIKPGTRLIADSACGDRYNEWQSVKSIVFPDSVEYIGAYAFVNCGYLTSVILPDSVKTVGDFAFDGGVLKELVLGNGIKSIGNCAFSTYVTEITLPDSIEHLGGSAFYGLVEKLNIPKNSKYFSTRDGAVFNKDGTELIWSPMIKSGEYVVPDGVKSIADYAFYLSSLTSVVLPEGLESIGENAFSYSGIKTVNFPDGIKSIGDRAFDYCSNLTTIDLPDSLTFLGQSAFANCSALKEVKLSKGITTIPQSAFSGCGGLTEIVIPEGVTDIEYGAFQSTGIKSITIPTTLKYATNGLPTTIRNVYINDLAKWCENALSYGTLLSNGADLYLNGELVKDLVIPNGVTSIPENCFYGCTSIATVSIPDSVTSIGYGAFSNCSNLLSVNIPAGVKSFKSNYFNQCYNLLEVRFEGDAPEFIQYGSDPFQGCPSNMNIMLPAGNTTWTSSAKYNSADKTLFGYPVVFYGEGACPHNADSYTKVVTPTSCGMAGYTTYTCPDCGYTYRTEYVAPLSHNVVRGICTNCHRDLRSAYGYCGGDTSAEYDESSKAYKNLAWYVDNEGVLTIYGTGKMKDYKDVVGYGDTDAYWGYSTINSLVVENGVTSIGDYAFARKFGYSSANVTVTLADSVTDIGDYAFYFCDEITEFDFGSGVKRIGDNACYCIGVSKIVIPDSVESIGQISFASCNNATSLYIGSGLKSIGANAFAENFTITDITISPDNPYYKIENGVLVSRDEKTLIMGIAGAAGTAIVPEGVTEIPMLGFMYCMQIDSVELPSTLNYIGSVAFAACMSLTKVTFAGDAPELAPPDEGFGGADVFYLCGEGLTLYAPKGNDTWTDPKFYDEAAQTWHGYHIVFYEAAASDVANGTCGDDLKWSLSESGVLTIKGTGAMTDFTAEAPAPWAEYAADITEVKVGDGVTTIGSCAFNGCENLAKISLPATLAAVGEKAVTGTAYYNAAANWEDGVLYLGNILVAVDSDVKEVIIRDGTTFITADAFKNNTKVEAVVIPASLETIAADAFSGCTSLKTILIANGITAIGDRAFKGCSSLYSVKLPTTLVSIGKEAFSGCSKLKQAVFEGNAPTSFGENVFAGCAEGFTVYAKCNDTTWIIEPSVTSQDKTWNGYTFVFNGGHSYVDNVTKETTCTESGRIERVCSYCGYQMVEYVAPYGHTFEAGECIRCHVKEYLGQGYCGAEGDGTNIAWSLDSNGLLKIDGTGKMADYTADNPAPWTEFISEIKRVEISEGVTTIGSNAFNGCENLVKLDTPQSVISVGENAISGTAFYYDPINWDQGVLYIGSSAVSVNYSQETITIRDGTKVISGEIFKGNTKIKEVTIPHGVEVIESEAFYGCTALRKLVIPDGVTEIGERAFYDCSSISSLTVPESVTTIGNEAFANCSILRSAHFKGNAPTSFGENVFDGCSSYFTIYAKCGNDTWKGEAYQDSPRTWNGYTFVFNGDHNYVTDTQEATCTEKGRIETTCSYCGYKTVEITEALGHDYVIEEITPATCTESGKNHVTCTRCDYSEDVTVSPHHNLVNGECTICPYKEYIASGYCGGDITAEKYGESSIYKNLTWTIDQSGCLKIDGSGPMADFGRMNEDDEWDDVAAPWYEYADQVTKVEIMKGVTSIGNNAFYGLCNVYSIETHGGIKEIGESALEDTKYYKDTKNWTDGVLYIADYVVDIDEDAEKVVIAEETKVIAAEAFWNCTNLKEITIPEGVISIGNEAFRGCTSIERIMLPKSLETIGYKAFADCTGLKTLSIPGGIESIGEGAFSACTSLDSATFDGDAPKEFGKDVFKDCAEGFTIYTKCGYDTWKGEPYQDSPRTWNGYSIKFTEPHSFVETITPTPATCTQTGMRKYECSFCGYNYTEIIPALGHNYVNGECTKCYELQDSVGGYCGGNTGYTYDIESQAYTNLTWELNRTTGVLTIDGTSFMKDYSTVGSAPWYNYRSEIKTVKITKGVGEISFRAFRDCINLTSVEVENGNKVYCSWNDVLYSKNKNELIFCPEAKSGIYEVHGGLKTIKEEAFYNCRLLTEVDINNAIVSVEDEAFYGCSNLKFVVFAGKEPAEFGNNVFDNCDDGFTVIAVNSNKKWEKSNAYNAEEKTWQGYKIQFEKSSKDVKTEGNTDYLELNYGVVEVGSKGEMTKLESPVLDNAKTVVITEGTTSIPNNMFEDCKSIEAVEIANSVSEIGNEAFKDCENLTEVSIPASVESIGDSVFEGCDNLANIVVDENNPNFSAENGILYNKEKTEIICCPGGMDEESVTIPDNVNTISNGAFKGCDNLKNIKKAQKPKLMLLKALFAAPMISDENTLKIPEGIETIGSEAFAECGSIVKVVIPASVKTIGENAFASCSNLVEIEVDKNNDYFCSVDGVLFTKDMKTLVSVPAGKTGNFKLPTSVEEIRKGAFTGCTSELTVSLTSGGNFGMEDADIFSPCIIQIVNDDSSEVTYVYTKENPATCTESGYIITEYIKGSDIRTETETVEATGHVWSEWKTTKDATCTASGEITRHCTVEGCIAEETEPITATGHKYIPQEVIAPTCESDGFTTYKCRDCEDRYTDDIVDKLGHDFGEWVVTKAATCTEAGIKTHSCTHDGCDKSETEEIPALGHTMIPCDGKTATCTEAGYKDHYFCSACKNYFSDESGNVTIGNLDAWKLGEGKTTVPHDYVLVDTVPAQADKTGVWAHYECKTCDKLLDTEKNDTTADALVIPKLINGNTSGKLAEGDILVNGIVGLESVAGENEAAILNKSNNVSDDVRIRFASKLKSDVAPVVFSLNPEIVSYGADNKPVYNTANVLTVPVMVNTVGLKSIRVLRDNGNVQELGIGANNAVNGEYFTVGDNAVYLHVKSFGAFAIAVERYECSGVRPTGCKEGTFYLNLSGNDMGKVTISAVNGGWKLTSGNALIAGKTGNGVWDYSNGYFTQTVTTTKSRGFFLWNILFGRIKETHTYYLSANGGSFTWSESKSAAEVKLSEEFSNQVHNYVYVPVDSSHHKRVCSECGAVLTESENCTIVNGMCTLCGGYNNLGSINVSVSCHKTGFLFWKMYFADISVSSDTVSIKSIKYSTGGAEKSYQSGTKIMGFKPIDNLIIRVEATDGTHMYKYNSSTGYTVPYVK